MPPDFRGQGQGGHRPGDGHGARPQQAPVPSRIPEEIENITFGSGIKRNLYSDIAEAAAKLVAGDRQQKSNVKDNKPSQLRRFYDEL